MTDDLTPRSHDSILGSLEKRTGSQIRVQLIASDDQETPVVRVRGEREGELSAGELIAKRYRVEGEIARGGVGVVYKAKDVDLGRDVAVKVLHERFRQHIEILQRFVEEAQIGGQLQHPGIVPVYEIGLCADQRPFIAMKMVKGETLAAQLERRKDPAEDRHRILNVFEQVCHTVAYAHARRVVHRDLKPSNVMVGAFGEVQIVDWGFAKVLRAGGVADEAKSIRAREKESHVKTLRSAPREGKDVGSESQVGSAIGTPAYMPPEQARGEVEEMDQRSDVFALGAILCEILTGAPPYTRDDDGEDLLVQASQAKLDAAYRRLGDCRSDAELVELCKQCLSPARHARPRDAAEVARRIEDHLAGIEARAREAEVAAAAARVRTRFSYALAISVLVTVAVAVGSWLWIRGEREQHEQELQTSILADLGNAAQWREKADGAQDRDRVGYYDKALSLARHAVETADKSAGNQELLARAKQLVGEIEVRRLAAAIAYRETRLLQRLIELRVPKDEDVASDGWDSRRIASLDDGYKKIFVSHGVDVDALAPAAAAAELSGGRDAEVAAALDHWALVRRGRLENRPQMAGEGIKTRQPAPDSSRWRHLQRVARALDPNDTWRNNLRDCLASRPDTQTVLRLWRQADFKTLAPVSVIMLAATLHHVGEREACLEALRDGQRHHPQDFDLNFKLALSLERRPHQRWQEAAQYYTAALSLRPRMAVLTLRLAFVMSKAGEPEQARKWFGRAIELNPDLAEAHWGQSKVLGKMDPDRSLYHLRKAVELRPQRVRWEMGLGRELQRRGKNRQAAQVFRKITQRDKTNITALQSLGVTLHMCGDKKGSAEAREAFEGLIGMMAQGDAGSVLRLANSLYADDGFATSSDVFEIILRQKREFATPATCYRAAVAAIMAASGKGKDASFVAEDRRPALRGVALKHLDHQLAREPQPTRLKRWLDDPRLASVRDEAALQKLPPGEASAWRAFWKNVATKMN